MDSEEALFVLGGVGGEEFYLIWNQSAIITATSQDREFNSVWMRLKPQTNLARYLIPKEQSFIQFDKKHA